MRILVVVHGFPPFAQGGSELHAHALAVALATSHGDDVLVLTREADANRPEFDVREEARDGIRIVWINNTFRSVRQFADTYDDERVTQVAASLIDGFAPDVAHLHHLTCLSTGIVELLQRRRVPTVMTLHDYWLMCHRGQLLDLDLRPCDGPGTDGCSRCIGGSAAPPWAFTARRLLGAAPEAAARWLAGAGGSVVANVAGVDARMESRRRTDHMRRVSARVDRFLAPSRYIRGRFVEFGIPAERIDLAEYGIERARFTPGHASTPSTPATIGGVGAPGSRPPLRLGFIGSVMASKGLHVLLDALATLPAGSATIDVFGSPVPYHGDASYEDVLRPRLATAGVRVHGPVEHHRVPDVLRSLDLLVVPSIWAENSPLVIREALASRVPVVASRIGGIPETVVDGVNGRLFRAGDVEDLAHVLREIVEQPASLEQLRAGIAAPSDLSEEVAELRRVLEELRTAARRQVVAAKASAAPAQVALTAIVLNYRRPDETLLGVKSLLASDCPPDGIVVIDNDPDGRCRAMLHELPTARRASISYRAMDRNVGFPAGVNAGVRLAREGGARRVLLVNSDVVLRPDCLTELVRVMDARGAGIVAPTVLCRSAPGTVGTAGISYDRRSGRMRHPEHGRRHRPAHDDGRPVDAVSGCVMLIEADVFDRIGTLDEAYFFGFEDIDFCLRARDAGIDVLVASGAVAYHEGGQSIGAASVDRFYYAARNHLRLARSSGAGAGGAARFWRPGHVALLNVAHAMRSRGGSMAARLGAVARGARDYWRGKYGHSRSSSGGPEAGRVDVARGPQSGA